MTKDAGKGAGKDTGRNGVKTRVFTMALDIQEALDRAPDWCATFEVSGDEARWVQFVDGVINAAWPYPGAPDSRFAKMGSIELTGWSRSQFATGKLELADRTEIAKWIDRYFLEVLECDPSFEIYARMEKL